MLFLDLTLPTPAENLALDEALLDEAEATEATAGVVRLWESPAPIVVIGRSSKIDEEVDRDLCRRREIPVLRRVSGGASIVAGPGCLMYAVVLSYARYPQVQQVREANQFVLERICTGLKQSLPAVQIAGLSDLVLDGRKFSGNSLRCKRSHLLYHGTLLYDFPLSLVPEVLRTPPRQPDYRAGRGHGEFIRNLPMDGAALRRAVVAGWQLTGLLPDWPRERTAALVAEKYSRAEWHERL